MDLFLHEVDLAVHLLDDLGLVLAELLALPPPALHLLRPLLGVPGLCAVLLRFLLGGILLLLCAGGVPLKLLLGALVLVECDLELRDQLLQHLDELRLVVVLALQPLDRLALLLDGCLQLLVRALLGTRLRLAAAVRLTVDRAVRVLVEVSHQALESWDFLPHRQLLRMDPVDALDAVDRA